jgi:spore germination protein YaaH
MLRIFLITGSIALAVAAAFLVRQYGGILQFAAQGADSVGHGIAATITTTQAAVTPAPTPVPAASTEIMAWVYPGSPACNAAAEYADGRDIDILKPEYFKIDEEGTLVLLTESNAGCNGYSSKNIADIKRFSTKQYVTVSSAYTGSMDTFITHALIDRSDIDTLVNFAVDNSVEGIELDFEDFGAWDPAVYARYKQFVNALGTALHAKGKKLMIDVPAIGNANEQTWFVWKYEDFAQLPVDRIVVMAYDYQYDYGAGAPIAPATWIRAVTTWTLARYPYPSRVSIGIPSYGYRGTNGTYKIRLLTYAQLTKEPGFSNAKRDTASQEMTWKSGSNVYFYPDAESMRQKAKAATDLGITSLSVWHLGGNRWFNN